MDAERFHTAAERRAMMKKKAAVKDEIQRNIEDDFWWIPVDQGGDEW